MLLSAQEQVRVQLSNDFFVLLVFSVDYVHPLSDHVNYRHHLHVKVFVVPVQRDCLHECVRLFYKAINLPDCRLHLLRNFRFKHFQTPKQGLCLIARLICLVDDFVHLDPVGLKLHVNLPQSRELQVRPLFDLVESPSQILGRDTTLHCFAKLIKPLIYLLNFLQTSHFPNLALHLNELCLLSEVFQALF